MNMNCLKKKKKNVRRCFAGKLQEFSSSQFYKEKKTPVFFFTFQMDTRKRKLENSIFLPKCQKSKIIQNRKRRNNPLKLSSKRCLKRATLHAIFTELQVSQANDDENEEEEKVYKKSEPVLFEPRASCQSFQAHENGNINETREFILMLHKLKKYGPKMLSRLQDKLDEKHNLITDAIVSNDKTELSRLIETNKPQLEITIRTSQVIIQTLASIIGVCSANLDWLHEIEKKISMRQ